MKRQWTQIEQEAIDANPDLPEEVAAAFASELKEISRASGEPNLARALGIPDGEGHPPAELGSIQELFPHLRDPRYV